MRRFNSAAGPRPIGGFSTAPVTWTILGVMVLAWFALELNGGSNNAETLFRFGAKDGAAIADGQWWRLVTPIFLHIGFLHLFANSFALVIFGGVVERTLGARNYLTVYLAAGVFGNVASFWAAPALGAGASGAVSGIVGAYGAYLLVNRRLFGETGRRSLSTIGIIVAVNIVFGLVVQGVDNWAHLGGFASGFTLGWWLAPRPRTFITESPDGMRRRTTTTVLFRARIMRWVLGLAVATALAAYLVYQIGDDYPYTRRVGPAAVPVNTGAMVGEGFFDGVRRQLQATVLLNQGSDPTALLLLRRGLGYLDTGHVTSGVADLERALDLGLPRDYEAFALQVLAELSVTR